MNIEEEKVKVEDDTEMTEGKITLEKKGEEE